MVPMQGPWSLVLVPGPWSLAPGPWLLVPGPCPWPLVPGPVPGPCSLVPGPWSLAPGPWPLVPGLMVPWSHGPMGPWAHAPMGPWAHGPLALVPGRWPHNFEHPRSKNVEKKNISFYRFSIRPHRDRIRGGTAPGKTTRPQRKTYTTRTLCSRSRENSLAKLCSALFETVLGKLTRSKNQLASAFWESAFGKLTLLLQGAMDPHRPGLQEKIEM